MSTINTKDIIIQAISNMKPSILFDILSEDLTYQEAHKMIFIEKLEDAFKKFKERGDIKLNPSPGICKSKDCTNKGCKGFSFIGNNSGASLDLIFEIMNEEITDIYHCRGMERDLGSVAYENKISINIGADEKAAFKPSTTYLYNVQKVDEAIKEFEEQDDLCFSKSDILYLVEKYKSLYEIVFNPFRGYTRFERFEMSFEALKEISKYVGKESEINVAMESFYEQKMISDKEILNWLIQFEDLGVHMDSFSYLVDNDVFENNENRAAIFNNRTGFKIYKKEFSNEIKFSQIFSEKYWNFIDRHKCQNKIDQIDSHAENYLIRRRLKDYIDLSKFEI